MIKFR